MRAWVNVHLFVSIVLLASCGALNESYPIVTNVLVKNQAATDIVLRFEVPNGRYNADYVVPVTGRYRIRHGWICYGPGSSSSFRYSIKLMTTDGSVLGEFTKYYTNSRNACDLAGFPAEINADCGADSCSVAGFNQVAT